MFQSTHRDDFRESDGASAGYAAARMPAASRFAHRCLELAALRSRWVTRTGAPATRPPPPLLMLDTSVVMAAVAPLFMPKGPDGFVRRTAPPGAAVRRLLVPMVGDRRLAVDVVPQALRFEAEDLIRLLQELVDNARRHAPVGSTVRVRGAPGMGGYQLSVTNSGPRLPRWVSGALRQSGNGALPPGGDGLQLGLTMAAALAALNHSALEVVRGGGRPNTLRVIVRTE